MNEILVKLIILLSIVSFLEISAFKAELKTAKQQCVANLPHEQNEICVKDGSGLYCVEQIKKE